MLKKDENHENLRYYSQSSEQDLRPGLLEYDSVVPTTRL